MAKVPGTPNPDGVVPAAARAKAEALEQAKRDARNARRRERRRATRPAGDTAPKPEPVEVAPVAPGPLLVRCERCLRMVTVEVRAWHRQVGEMPLVEVDVDAPLPATGSYALPPLGAW